MAKRCVVEACPTNYEDSGIIPQTQLHEFPKDAILMENWIKSIVLQNKQSLAVTKNMTICAKHFESNMFEKSSNNHNNFVILKSDALPTIYPENTPDNIESVTIKEEHLITTDINDNSIKCNGNESKNEPTIYEEIEYIDDTDDDSDDDSIKIINDDPLTIVVLDDDDDDNDDSSTSFNNNITINKLNPTNIVTPSSTTTTTTIQLAKTLPLPKGTTIKPVMDNSSDKKSGTIRYPGDVKVESLTGGVHLKRAIATFEAAISKKDEKIKHLKLELANSDAEIKKLQTLIDAERYKKLISKIQ